MSPAPVSLSWAPGERLLTSVGDAPSHDLHLQPSLPPPFRNLFFAGHLRFIDRHTPAHLLSPHYRAIILDCKSALARLPASPANDALSTALTHAHTVWHFIEVLYLTDRPDDDRHISHFLSEWYVVNLSQGLYDPGLQRTSDDHFWRAFTDFLAIGDLATARELLAARINDTVGFGPEWAAATAAANLTDLSDAPPTSPLVAVDALLSRAPDSRVSTRLDASWQQWQRACAMWARAPELDACPPAQAALALVSGEPARIAAACTSWHQMLVACTVFMRDMSAPGGNVRGGFGLLAAACAEASAAFAAPDAVAGGALVEAALGNAEGAIKRLEASMPTSWFSAHLCDLLTRAGKLPDAPERGWGVDRSAISMREFYLKEFARGLERYRGCWRVAVDYYIECPAHGTSMLIDLLSRVPLQGAGDPVAEKVLLVCEKRKLPQTAKRICEKLGEHCLHLNNLGGAMSWFLRADLEKRAQYVADMALQRAEREGASTEGATALAYIVTAITNFADERMRERFDYMRVYHDLQEALAKVASLDLEEDKEDAEACALDFIAAARSLVGGGGLPRRYWGVVSYEAARFIETYSSLGAQFSRGVVLELLGALELASGPHRSDELVKGLRERLTFEATADGQVMHDSAQLAAAEQADNALEHCRSIFVTTVAARINGV